MNKRAPDVSRGSNDQQIAQNIARAKEAAKKAKSPEGLTTLGRAFFAVKTKT